MLSRLWSTILCSALVAAAFLPFAHGVAAQTGDRGWSAEYWPNPNLAGGPILRTTVPEINFEWGLGGPADLPSDNFSARFTRQVTFPGGPVRFFARSDDGIRLWVNDRLLIDHWYDHPAGEVYAANISLAPGTYTIRVEYYERFDRAHLQVWWETVPVEALSDWTAQYWANQDLRGDPVLVTRVPEVNFHWGWDSPAAVLPSDRFSARFTRTVMFPAGDYRFYARADDGGRVWIDNWLVIDEWRVGTATLFQGDFLRVGTGAHVVQVEYFEQTEDAMLQVWWERIGGGEVTPIRDPWVGQYFANPNLQGEPVVITADPTIAYNWGVNAPYASLPADNFSVRWTKTVTLSAGDYEFIAEADDGVRVFLDGWTVIDNWQDGAFRTSRGTFRNVGAGPHTVTVEYYERTGGAAINFGWNRLR